MLGITTSEQEAGKQLGVWHM